MLPNKKLKELPKAKFKKDTYGNMTILARSIIAAVMFIISFVLSNNAFFKENPLYGRVFLAEILISVTAALVGFYLVPLLIWQLRIWIETFLSQVVKDIVWEFWEQQTDKINRKKREKQKIKSLEEKKKIENIVKNGIVLDTSVLIDGRILEIIKTGFVSSTLIISPVVLNELHLISDNDDKLKRERGRRGLDIVNELKKIADVVSPNIDSKEIGVDKKLLEFSKRHKLRLMTLDFNLNKLATAQGVRVLNVNELVEAIKLNLLPGEKITVKIVQKGKERKQGVGYLSDGTMIVVEDSQDHIEQEVSAKITRVIQSQAGKIIFCDMQK